MRAVPRYLLTPPSGGVAASGALWLQPLDRAFIRFLQPSGKPVDFLHPAGEPALVPAGSVSWRVYANPVALLVGGVAAVLLELAEPRVRAGVWEHTRFREAPLQRLQRTGLAALVTVYAPHSTAERMIEGITRRHASVHGTTPEGLRYDARDPVLLDWVHATAMWGFLQAYHRYVAPIDADDRDRYYAEGGAAAQRYGALSAPRREIEWQARLAAMRPRLTPSPVVTEFLHILQHARLLPWPLRALQTPLLKAAVALLPLPERELLGLQGWQPSKAEAALVRSVARAADALPLPSAPWTLAARRLRHAGGH